MEYDSLGRTFAVLYYKCNVHLRRKMHMARAAAVSRVKQALSVCARVCVYVRLHNQVISLKDTRT